MNNNFNYQTPCCQTKQSIMICQVQGVRYPRRHFSQMTTIAMNVATLVLSSQPRQGLARMRAKKEARESHLMFPGV